MSNEQANGVDPEQPVKSEAAARAPEPDTQESASGADQLRERIGVLERQAEEARDRALRAQAELDNLRKRTARDVENAHRYALERFVSDLLPVIDSVELGLSAADSAETTDGLRQGMDLTRKMFLDTMARFGVATIDPAGEKFNPERHQAVSVQQIEGTDAGTVVAVMQKGYELNGRLVRPAMVVVAK